MSTEEVMEKQIKNNLEPIYGSSQPIHQYTAFIKGKQEQPPGARQYFS